MTSSLLKVLSSRRTTFRELGQSLFQYRHLLTLLIFFALIFAFVFSHLIHIASNGIPYFLFAYSGITLWGFAHREVEVLLPPEVSSASYEEQNCLLVNCEWEGA